jgi:hypothetical protein
MIFLLISVSDHLIGGVGANFSLSLFQVSKHHIFLDNEISNCKDKMTKLISLKILKL